MNVEQLTPPCEHPESVKRATNGIAWCLYCLDALRHSDFGKQLEIQKRIDAIQTQAALQTKYKTAMLTPRFMDKDFSNFVSSTLRQQAVVDRAQLWTSDFTIPGSDLVLIGNTGTGKDHLATAIAKVIISKGMTVLYSDAEKLHRRIRDGYRIEKEPEQSVMDTYASVDLLVINELGIRTSDALTGMLTEISNDRVNNMKKTIWIGNLSIKMFEEKLGDRAFDRIVLKDKSNVLVFDWDSYRP